MKFGYPVHIPLTTKGPAKVFVAVKGLREDGKCWYCESRTKHYSWCPGKKETK